MAGLWWIKKYIELAILCDICEYTGNFEREMKSECLEDARESGWLIDRKNKRTICPDCIEGRRKKK